jgi:hypothetical protein
MKAVSTAVLTVSAREDYHFIIKLVQREDKNNMCIQNLQYVYEPLKKCTRHQLSVMPSPVLWFLKHVLEMAVSFHNTPC